MGTTAKPWTEKHYRFAKAEFLRLASEAMAKDDGARARSLSAARASMNPRCCPGSVTNEQLEREERA